MTFTDARINAGVDARLGATVYVSAHTAYSASGANEVTGGSYARQLMAMDAAASRISDNTASETIPIPAATTVTWLGLWTAVTSGTFLGMAPLGSTISAVGMAIPATENSAPADTLWVPGHGMSADDTVTVLPIDGSVPTGLTAGTTYYVIGTPTTNSLQISASQGGAAVNMTAAGSLILADIAAETFTAAGSLSISAGAFDVIGLA